MSGERFETPLSRHHRLLIKAETVQRLSIRGFVPGPNTTMDTQRQNGTCHLHLLDEFTFAGSGFLGNEVAEN